MQSAYMGTRARTKTVAGAAAGATTIICDLYLRLSDGRKENGSFADREKALRGKASQLGWTVRKVVIENDLMNGSKSASAFKRRALRDRAGNVIRDEFTGKPKMRVWRPGFRSILEAIATRQIQAVLAEDLDRTLRDPYDAEDLLGYVQDTGAYAASLSGSLTLTAGGTDGERMMVGMLVQVKRQESADKMRRAQDGRERQAAHGIWGGGRRPYGFKPVPNPSGNHQNTRLVVDEAEAKVIRHCADQVLSKTFGEPGGNSLKSIAKDLRDRNVPTVTGARWTAESLRDVLVKPTNAGIVVHDGQETDVRLPGEPILPEDTYRAVVAKLRDPARSTPGRAPCWLGTNLYRCVCGSVMEIQGGTTRARTYRCAREGGAGAVHVRRNAAAVDAFVGAVLIERLSRNDAVDLLASPTQKVDVKAVRRKVNEQQEILDGWARDRAEGVCTRDEWLVGTKTARAKLEALQAQLAAVTDRSPLEGIVGAVDVQGTWERLSLGQRRVILAELITVTILPTSRKGRGFDPDTITIRPA